ncbi:MAG: BTAD domain-containing putative transcriptional regulator [Sphingomonadaceae bacterium]
MLGLLISAPDYRISRSALSGQLWPDVDDKTARHRLATILWRLRKASDCFSSLLSVSGKEIVLSMTSEIWIDALWLIRRCEKVMAAPSCLDHRIERQRLLRALRLYCGTFLTRCDQDAVMFERERIRALYLDASYELACANARHQEWGATLEVCRDLCTEEPLREDAQRLFITTLDRAGQHALAIQQYHRLESLLQSEIGVPPMPETKALYSRLIKCEPAEIPVRGNIMDPGAGAAQNLGTSADSTATLRQRQLLEKLHMQVKNSLTLIEQAVRR